MEGFFYSTTEESYAGAWKTLDERYGHHFKVQEAFREKLSKWPKIAVKDGAGFQEYADFLKACKDAMAQIKGLSILNDCKENQRLTSKLPDWVASRWNREVTRGIEEKGEYPDFQSFVEFVSREARIACNPITSFSASKDVGEVEKIKEVPKGGNPRQPNRNKGTTLSTTVTEKGDQTNERKCEFCKGDHTLGYCSKFEEQPILTRKTFVQKGSMCFGCLKRGHRAKDCHTRHVCKKCRGRHPTVLHEERPKEPSETTPARAEASTVSCKATADAEEVLPCLVHLDTVCMNYTTRVH